MSSATLALAAAFTQAFTSGVPPTVIVVMARSPLSGFQRFGVISADRDPEVQEIKQVPSAVRPQAIGDERRGRVWRVGLVDQRVRRPRDRAQLDGDDVVEHPPTVRETSRIAPDQPQWLG